MPDQPPPDIGGSTIMPPPGSQDIPPERPAPSPDPGMDILQEFPLPRTRAEMTQAEWRYEMDIKKKLQGETGTVNLPAIIVVGFGLLVLIKLLGGA